MRLRHFLFYLLHRPLTLSRLRASSACARLLAILACLYFFTGCKPSGQTDTKDANRPLITVSIEPLRYITERIAGDGYRVETFVPKGSSPEIHEPTPEQMMKLGQSMVYFTIGDLGFERTWTDRLQQTCPKVPFVRTSKGIKLIEGHHHGTSDKPENETDPHIWSSPARMKTIAQNICAALCKLDTAHTRNFRRNLQLTLAELQTTDDSIHTLVDSLNHKAFLIYNPTLTYFAQDYGLTQITIETDGKEPSPAQLVRLIRLCKEKQVRTIFVQQEFDRKNAELIAKETGTHIVNINPLSYEWKEEMLKIARTLHAQ